MPLYTCEMCNFSTKIKTHHKRHLNTNKHKNNLKEIMEIDCTMSQNEPKRANNEPQFDEKYKCDYCEATFKTMPIKRRHENYRCKNNTESMLKKENLKLKNEKQLLYKQIEKLIDKAGNTTINNTQNNMQTNNIKLNSYGNEDMSHITDSLKTQLLKIPFGMIPKLIEAVHFNNEKPENKNIALTNKKENKIKIFSNDKWIYKDKDQTITDLVDGKYFILDMHYNELNKDGSINFEEKNNYQKFQTIYDEKNKELYEKLNKDCEMLLLNNR